MAQLALAGGAPVRTSPFPSWPVFDAEEERALIDVLHSGKWFLADRVAEFEKSFAAFQDAQFGIALSSGTTALQVTLQAIDIQPGDEVIVPPYTFIATASAVVTTGGIPIFADIDPDTYNIDPQAVEAAITPRTRALIAVHIAGRPADMDALTAIAQQHGIHLLEDACQAHAAAWKGQKVGAIGDLGTFSFQASKNLCAGEGGFIVSNDRILTERAWSIHNCGRSPQGAWYEHPLLGSNYRLGEFQAGILLSQLQRLETQTALRTRNAELLTKLLSKIDGIAPLADDERVTTHANHLYILRYNAAAFGNHPRDRFIEALQQEGISCSSGYVPLYAAPAFSGQAQQWPFDSAYFDGKPDYTKVHCPQTERICREEAVWLTQNMLLGPEQDMHDIAAAISKIQQCSAEL